jgi:DNA-directed RNA polymerase specialized sigma24 family protein
VQETGLRLSRSDASTVDNFGGWLTTVVGRVCLDTLRARQARPEEPVGEQAARPRPEIEDVVDPEQEALLGDFGRPRAAGNPGHTRARRESGIRLAPTCSQCPSMR